MDAAFAAQEEMKYYIAFFDESGTKEIDDLSQNLYSITAVLYQADNIQIYGSSYADTLKKYFNDEAPELKANWMRFAKEREKHYLIPYQLSEESFKHFTLDYYSTLRSLDDVWILSSIVNKSFLKASYKRPFNPNALAYELLVQRLANFATQHECKFTFIYDEFPEGKTKAGNKWQDLLVEQHKHLKNGYSSLTRNWLTRNGMDYTALPDVINFQSSTNNMFLQSADICGYNIKRQTERYFDRTIKENYWGYEEIKPKMHRCPISKAVKNFGVVIFPEKIASEKK